MSEEEKPVRSTRVPCEECGKMTRKILSDLTVGKGKYCSVFCKTEATSFNKKVLAALPNTIAGVALKAGIEEGLAAHILRRLANAGRAHAAGLACPWPKRPGKAFAYTVYYDLGPALREGIPSAARPAMTYYLREMILGAMPGNCAKISARTGIPAPTVTTLVRSMRSETPKLCYIKRWDRPLIQGFNVAYYALGNKPDAVYVRPESDKKQWYARYIKKLERAGKLEAYREKQRAKKAYRKIRFKTGDPLINALFGAPHQRKQLKDAA